jgi:hypothetical protein
MSAKSVFPFPYKKEENKTPIPFVFLRIRDSIRGIDLNEIPAIVDSGTTTSCIPESFTEHLPEELFSFTDKIKYGDSDKYGRAKIINFPLVEIDFIDVSGKLILTKEYEKLTFVVGSKGLVKKEGLLGLDILNKHVCILDGLNLQCIIEKTWP